MTLGQIFRPQSALNHILIRAPIEQICEHHAGKQRGKGRGVTRPADRVEFLRVASQYDRDAGAQTALAESRETQ